MLIRDWKGNLFMARACPVEQKLCPLTTELLAIKEALTWCLSAGYSQGELSTDCKEASKLVSVKDDYLGTDCFLVKEVRSLLRNNPGFYCNFSFREINAGANGLARVALSYKRYAMWFYQGPDWLMNLLQADVPDASGMV